MTPSSAGELSGRDARLAYLALAAAGCLWATGFLFGKIVLRELGVTHMIFYRFVFACVGLAPAVLRRGRDEFHFLHPRRVAESEIHPDPVYGIPRKDWGWIAAAAIVGVPVQFLVQFEGLARTTVTHASFMVGTLPVVLALGAAVFMKERLDRRGWWAIFWSTLGVALIAIASPDDAMKGGATFVGDALVLCSLVAAVAWMLLNKQLMGRYPPLFISAVIVLVGTPALAVWTFITVGLPPVRLSAGVWAALAAQGIVATTLTTLLWNWGLSVVPASRAGVFVNLEPVVGVLLGVVVLHETIGVSGLLGGACIVGAAVAVTRKSA
jgi:drug/metabolite transporter (DMT)-like permease